MPSASPRACSSAYTALRCVDECNKSMEAGYRVGLCNVYVLLAACEIKSLLLETFESGPTNSPEMLLCTRSAWSAKCCRRTSSPTWLDQGTGRGGRATTFAPTARAKPSEGAKTASWKSSAEIGGLPERSNCVNFAEAKLGRSGRASQRVRAVKSSASTAGGMRAARRARAEAGVRGVASRPVVSSSRSRTLCAL